MYINGSLLKKAFGLFSSKRSRVVCVASFLVIFGIFLVFKPSFASFSGVVLGIVGWLVEIWVWLMGQLIALIVYVLVAVANYNNFSGSEAVSTGWVIVRDIANMFFVIIFLLIAFGTMLGVSQYHYSKTLPRLLLMAILINFSKTIAGLMIDFSQVIMMTFVNGFSAAAGGNFLEVLQISHLTEIRAMPGEDVTTDNWDAVGGLILASVVATVSVVVMTIMAMVLVMRIVMLWLLVVISPLAFFVSAVPSTSISGKFNEWMKMFTAELVVGPVLAFFIWLSLAVVSSVGADADRIASTATIEEHVEIAGGEAGVQKIGESVSAISSGIGDESVMIKYMIGLGMLIGGLVMAKQAGAAGSGMAGAGIGFMKKYGTKTAKWVGKTTYGAAEGRTRGVREKAYSGLSRAGIPLASGFATKRLGKLRGKRKEESGEAAGIIGGLNEKETNARYSYLKKKGGFLRTEKENAQFSQLEENIAQGAMFKDDLTSDERQRHQDVLKGMKKRAEATGDKTLYEKIDKFKKMRPDLLDDKDHEETMGSYATTLEMAQKISLKALNPDTAGGKNTLDSIHSNKETWDSFYRNASGAKKELMKKYLDSFDENQQLNPESSNYEKDVAKRRAFVQSRSDEQLKGMDSKLLTPEVIKDMTGHQVEVMLTADKIKVDSVDVSDATMAGQIAQHGTARFKEDVQRKAGKEYISALQTNKKDNYNAGPNGYDAPTLAVSKEILRTGGGAEASFNVNVNTGNFGTDERGGQDMVSFDNALREEKGGDPVLALDLKPEEIKGQVEQVIKDALYDTNALRKVARSARTDNQKESLELIIQNVYEEAKDKKDDDMMRFMERTRGIRNNIPKEMKQRGGRP